MRISKNTQYLLDVTKRLLSVDSPTGFTNEVTKAAVNELKDLGFESAVTRKGSVLAELGGEGKPIIVTAHLYRFCFQIESQFCIQLQAKSLIDHLE